MYVTVLKVMCVCHCVEGHVLNTSCLCHSYSVYVSPPLGSSGSPDPFASIPLPSCDPQLGLLRLMGHDQSPPLMGHGQSPPLVARRCWDSSEPHMPDYGPPSLDSVSEPVCVVKR